MPDSPPPNRKGRPRGSGSFPWRAFFEQSSTPVFVLGKGRRLRFANAAWESLTGAKLADCLGMVCSPRRHGSALGTALAPTPEAEAGRPDRARRVPPTARNGPPWWDITFVPLAGENGPFGVVGFVAVVGEAAPAAVRKLPPALAALRDRHAMHFTFDLFAGPALPTQRLLAQLRHAAHATAPVWLWGEPGTGKETAARVLHHAGPRRNLAFVGVDCAGLQPYLIESLFSGHGGVLESGHVGTVYLKEPESLPRDSQQRLAAGFAAETPGRPRLVCGSARPAWGGVTAGKLLPAFHTALSVLELPVPPLRDRLADLPRLVARLAPDAVIAPEAFEVLCVQPWPGNLRELADVLVEATATAAGGPVKPEHLPRELRLRAGIAPPDPPARSLALDPILETVEKRLIALAMRKTGGHHTKAAELLGVFRTRLSRRLEALGLNEAGGTGAGGTGP
jgi:transcriptional regulator with PAS, ATPase and Fis domain